MRSGSPLNHPHILPLLDSGEADGFLYYVMPYVAGESLRQRMDREGRLPIDESLQIADEVADALDHAHKHDVIHRDIKPENILLSGGHAVVADFGIAVAVSAAGGERVTETGIAVGTPSFMSPEQASGDAEIDERTDIYSLGCVLYEMLGGEPPHSGDTPQAILTQKLVGELRPIRELRPETDAALEAVLARALEVARDDRFPTAGEFSRALRSPDVGWSLASKRLRARRRKMVAAAAGLVVVVLGGAWFLSQVRSPSSESLSPNKIAVLPFTVRGGDEVAYLGEGMVDLLSVSLSGWGEARSVDAMTLLNFVSREPDLRLDPERGRAIARHFGAGRYLLGSVVELGERLRMQATLYDATRELDVITEAMVEGREAELYSLVDQLAGKILGGQRGGPGGHLGRIASETTDSLEALKAFLEGQEAMRAPRNFERAWEAYQRAVDIDSTFALAWSRLAFIAGWTWATDPTFDYLDRAFRYSDRLSERELLKLQGFNGLKRGNSQEAERAFTAVLEQYPDDILVWNWLGALNVFFNWRRGQSISEARYYLERTLSLDPETGGPHWLLAHLASFEGKHDEAAWHLSQYFGMDSIAAFFRAARTFASGDSAAKSQIIEELQNDSDFEISTAASRVVQWTDDLAGVRRIARLLTDPQVRAPKICGVGHVVLAHIAAAGGQWTVAKDELAAAERLYGAPSIVFRAMLAAAPFWRVTDEELEAIREQLIVWDGSYDPSEGELTRHHRFPEGMYPLLRTYLLGVVSARLGDDDRAIAYADELEAPQTMEHARSLPSDLARSIHAQVALNQGRPAEALELLELAEMDALGGQFMYTLGTSFFMQNHERFLRAELLNQLGRDQEALGWYSSFELGRYRTAIYRGPTHLRRAEIYERLGDREKALEHYAHFVELWKDADPELQPRVEAARRATEALSPDL